MKFQSTLAACMALATLISALPQTSQVPANCPFDPAGVDKVGNANGKQFITGQCLSDADCASGCCANPCGICSGTAACFQPLGSTGLVKQGCGFPLKPDGGDQCILNRSTAADANGSGSNNGNGSNSAPAAMASGAAAAAAAPPPACTN